MNWKTPVKITGCLILSSVILSGSFCFLQAEEVINCWDETKKAHYLRRKISTAINVYTKQDAIPSLQHEEGIISGVEYDILFVQPDDSTLIKLDYSETPNYLDQLVDTNLLDQGYQRVAGINAGYFSNTSYEYGRPVGAVRVNNEWTTWKGNLNTPAYGSGYATAYFNNNAMEIRYHGWKNGRWCGDHIWSYWTGYLIDADNAISGSYTYFVNGNEIDITRGEVAGADYHHYGRALTIFGMTNSDVFFLLEFYGTIDDSKVKTYLRSIDVKDAIRLDGGGSCQMIYEDTLVNLPAETKGIHSSNPPLFEKDVVLKHQALARRILGTS